MTEKTNTVIINESCQYLLSEATNTPKSGSKITDKIITKLFKNIKSVSNNPDYKEIDMTEGNFQKFNKYGDLYNAELFLTKKFSQYTRDKFYVDCITTLSKTRNALLSNANYFMKSYKEGNKLIQMIYRSAVANYIICMGSIIANGIQVYKDEYNVLQVSLKPNMPQKEITRVMRPLKDFTDMVDNGELGRLLRNFDKETASVLNEAIFEINSNAVTKIIQTLKLDSLASKASDFISDHGGKVKTIGIIIAVIISAFIVLTRLTYFVDCTMIRLSKYLEEISLLLEVSASENNNPNIRNKQEKAAKVFRELSDKLAIDSKTASNKAEKKSDNDITKVAKDTADEMKKENKKDNKPSNTPTNTGNDDDIF